MSAIPVYVPTLQADKNDIQEFVRFIYKHQQLLKEYGAIKIQLNIDCNLALKKRRTNLLTPPVSTYITKINKDYPIYSVERNDNNVESIEQNSLVHDEADFWTSLSRLNNKQRQLNTSLMPNTSLFLEKQSHTRFDIHRVPGQSLLKLAGRGVVQKYTPCLKRAHGPGAIFPLTCTQQHLFSLDYHHEGGAHFWYIIPHSERRALQTLLDKQNISACLDHGKIFIDPSILEKYYIRYHRITQSPNEFVVLSAGTLSQCFTMHASYSESIAFALPSWIEEGHASISTASCRCDIPHDSLSITCDLNLFLRDLIEEYITSNLDNVINDAFDIVTNYDTPMTAMSTPCNLDHNSLHDEPMISRNMKVTVPPQRSLPSYHLLSSSLIASPDSNYSFEDSTNIADDNNDQLRLELFQEDSLLNTCDLFASDLLLTDSYSNNRLPEINTVTNTLDQNSDVPTNIHENLTIDSYGNNYDFSWEELMNLLPLDVDSVETTFNQTDECNNRNIQSSSFNTCKTNVTKQSCNKRQQLHEKLLDARKVLYVSGLRRDVTKHDIYTHFIGCSKVTLKEYHSVSHLKYAFVVHKKPKHAEINLHRPINYKHLGPQCRVEYAHDCSTRIGSNQTFDNKKILVRGIPQHVNVGDLRRLFGNCYIIKYCPAIVCRRRMETTTKSNDKVLLGYAYIQLDDERQTNYIIENANQYQMCGQSLKICSYRN
ncbi:unnamed protein product [Adineta steineri]|uniref:JmjC domain-containing protein n=1 Tax=Adineta steineri TaxID=433720 RepID=A0A813QMR3_9BILA|nr:unnamed protein product [Adineta steineri]CAF0769738.1 unnamed protein product [Adineta steineri]